MKSTTTPQRQIPKPQAPKTQPKTPSAQPLNYFPVNNSVNSNQQLHPENKSIRELLFRLNTPTPNVGLGHSYSEILNESKYAKDLAKIKDSFATNQSKYTVEYPNINIDLILQTIDHITAISQISAPSSIEDLQMFHDSLKIRNQKFREKIFNDILKAGYIKLDHGSGSHINQFQHGIYKDLSINLQPNNSEFKNYQLEQLKKQLAEIIRREQSKQSLNIAGEIITTNYTTKVNNINEDNPPESNIDKTNQTSSPGIQQTQAITVTTSQTLNNTSTNSPQEQNQASKIIVSSDMTEETLPPKSTPISATSTNNNTSTPDNTAIKIIQLASQLLTSDKPLSSVEKELQNLLNQSDKNNPTIQIILADLYCAGKFCKKSEDNISKAITALKNAYKSPLTSQLAIQRLYDIYCNLDNKPQEILIYKFIETKSKNKDILAMLMLGLLHYSQNYINKGNVQLKNALQNVAKNKYIITNKILTTYSVILEKHNNTELEIQLLEHMHKPSEDDSSEYEMFLYNKNRLISIYIENGAKAYKNQENPTILLEKAAVLGSTGAACLLAICYIRNHQKDKAVHWFNKTISLGETDELSHEIVAAAKYKLAEIYVKEKNIELAVQLLKEACGKFEEANYTLFDLYYNFNRDNYANFKSELTAAITYFEQQVKEENIYKAAFNLAIIYKNNDNLPKSSRFFAKTIQLIKYMQSNQTGTTAPVAASLTIAISYFHLRMYEEARMNFASARERIQQDELINCQTNYTYESQQIDQYFAMCLSQLGISNNNQEYLAKAIGGLEAGLDFERELAKYSLNQPIKRLYYQSYHINTYITLAKSYQHLGVFSDAIKYFESTLNQLEMAQNNDKSSIYKNELEDISQNYPLCLDKVYTPKEIYDSIVEMLKQPAPKLYKTALYKLDYLLTKTTDTQLTHSYHSALATCYRDIGDKTKALYHAEECCRIRENIIQSISLSQDAKSKELLNQYTGLLAKINQKIEEIKELPDSLEC